MSAATHPWWGRLLARLAGPLEEIAYRRQRVREEDLGSVDRWPNALRVWLIKPSRWTLGRGVQLLHKGPYPGVEHHYDAPWDTTTVVLRGGMWVHELTLGERPELRAPAFMCAGGVVHHDATQLRQLYADGPTAPLTALIFTGRPWRRHGTAA